jgi:hypothetical protein
MRVGLLAVLLLAASLAGCAEGMDSEAAVADQEPVEGMASTDTNATLEANNTSPVGTIIVDSMNGTAPLLVNFTLEAFDAEGDNLTWMLKTNGTTMMDESNGSLPQAFNVTLDAGNHTFFFTVNDGEFEHVTNVTIEVLANLADAVDPTAPIDMGWYIYDPVTTLCNVKEYEDVGGLGEIYESALGGGNWVLAEQNGVAGLQIADDHPTSGDDLGWEVAGTELCTDGDLIVV